MKYFTLFLFFLSTQVLAQQKKDSCCVTKGDLVGVWQRNTSRVGNGLVQHFEFLHDGVFVLHLGDDRDDMRDIIALKGKYRIDGDKLYFTVTSKTIVDGEIGISDGGVDQNIFSIGGKVKEIKESNPRELANPCYVTIINNSYIKINNEFYSLVSR